MVAEATAVAVRAVALDTYSPVELAARLTEMKAESEIIQKFFNEVMVKDHDYGVIPGTDKPALYKPGAEKLAEYYGYAPTVRAIEETADRETGFYRARVTIALVSKRNGTVVAEGVGEANTKEGRYRWRKGERACPECGAAAIIKGKAEYGGGWICFGKKGGCGAKFADSAPEIVAQAVGRIENDDPWTLWNTVLKMGKKRAVVDAVLSATRSSGIFTQDIEDLTDWVEGEFRDVPPEPKPAARQPAPAQAQRSQPAQPAPNGNGGPRQGSSAQDIVAFGKEVARLKLFMPDVIKESKAMFNKPPEQLTAAQRDSLLRAVSGEGDPQEEAKAYDDQACLHEAMYDSEGNLKCGKCGIALDDEAPPTEAEEGAPTLGI